MTAIIRFAFIATMLVASNPDPTALAQAALQAPNDHVAPLTFDAGVRALNSRAPTPQFAPLVPGLYARQILSTKSAKGDYVVEIWSLLVSPKASTIEARLPGAAVLSLNAGSIEIIAGDSRNKLEPGATAAVPEGASLRFVNADASRPAQLRAVILSGGR